MGWSFRKSISFGPFRLNFSKSGVGASIGVKGARISSGKRGTFLNLSSHVFPFRKRIDQLNKTMNNISSQSPVEHSQPLASESTENGKTSYYQYGEVAAQQTRFDPSGLSGSLDNVYQVFLSNKELDEEGIKNSIRRLQNEVAQKRGLIQQFKFDLESKANNKEIKSKRVEQLDVERIKIAERQPDIDYIPFAIGTLIVILLTLYLIVFYSSTGYAAFYGVKPGSLGFINPNVFTEAINRGPGVIAMIILFPVIFLGLGFLIHDALEKKKYFVILLLLLFTLITDAIIGYKISQAIHFNSFNAGYTNEQWKFSMILSDLNFFLVLALGFIVYIIWGVLLNYVLNKYKELQPDKALEIQLRNHDKKVDEERQELSELTSQINALRNQLRNLENDISEHEKDIIGYQNGVIPVNITQLKAALGDFINGWISFTQTEISKICVEARSVKDGWLEVKIEELSKS